MQIQIAEMRSALEADHAKRGIGELPTMPAWAVRRIFEKRSGLSLTKLPDGIEVRSIASLHQTSQDSARRARLQRVVSEAAADDAEEVKRLRLRYENLFN